MANPLVASPDDVDWSTGSSELGDVKSIIDDISDGKGIDAVFDVGGFAIDILSDALDPLGAVIGCAVGWIVEHVSFLREPVDVLAGDAQSIKANAQTWTNVSAALNAAAQQYADDVNGLSADAWSGVARQLYDAKAKGLVDVLEASAVAATVESGLITATGGLCAAFRAKFFEWISDFIEKAVMRGLIALANSTWSFGASLAAWVIDVEVEGGLLAAKIATEMSELLGKAARICSRFAGDAQQFERAARMLTQASESLARNARTLSNSMHDLQNTASTAEDATNLLKAVKDAGKLLHLGTAGNVVTDTKDGVDVVTDPSGDTLNQLIGDLTKQGAKGKDKDKDKDNDEDGTGS